MFEYDVSIIVTVFNHEKYVVKALDSILMQKTNYTYEVLVGEDCSTDSTRRILKKFEKNHAGKFKIFYREMNMLHSIPNNLGDLFKRAKGKYIANLEGDDYWIDPYKLQKQVDYLEKNKDYIAVSCNCMVVDKNSEPIDMSYPEIKEGDYTIKHYFSGIMPGQTGSMIYRNFYIDNSVPADILYGGHIRGDRLLNYILVTNGKVYSINETMIAYRYVTDEGSSYSATKITDRLFIIKWYIILINYAHKYSTKENIIYCETLFLEHLMHMALRLKISLLEFFKYINMLNYKSDAIKTRIKVMINKKILKKKFWI